MANINDYQKVNTFLLKNNINSILYGSLGVSVYLGNFKEFSDIDLLVDENFLKSDWLKLVKIMEDNGFKLVNESEHEFCDQKITVAFAPKIILIRDKICNPETDIQIHYQNGVKVITLNKESFIKAYLFSSKDGYRKNKRGKKDLNIVKKLQNIQ